MSDSGMKAGSVSKSGRDSSSGSGNGSDSDSDDDGCIDEQDLDGQRREQ